MNGTKYHGCEIYTHVQFSNKLLLDYTTNTTGSRLVTPEHIFYLLGSVFLIHFKALSITQRHITILHFEEK